MPLCHVRAVQIRARCREQYQAQKMYFPVFPILSFSRLAQTILHGLKVDKWGEGRDPRRTDQALGSEDRPITKPTYKHS